MKIHQALCAAALASAMSLPVYAGSPTLPFGVGQPITVPTDNVTVTLNLDHTSALYTGNLYFLGTGTASAVTNPAPNSDATGLGTLVFNNHTTPLGTTFDLPGVFSAGAVLHFAYDIIAPADAVTDLLRTDVAGDQMQFAWDPQNSFFEIEDIHLDDPHCDFDYNDIVVGVTFNPVPAPGALALLGMAGLFTRPSRRRR